MKLRIYPMTTYQGKKSAILDPKIVLESPTMFIKNLSSEQVVAYPFNRASLEFLERVRRLEEQLALQVYRSKAIVCSHLQDKEDFMRSLKSCVGNNKIVVTRRWDGPVPPRGTMRLEVDRVFYGRDGSVTVLFACTRVSRSVDEPSRLPTSSEGWVGTEQTV